MKPSISPGTHMVLISSTHSHPIFCGRSVMGLMASRDSTIE